MGRKRHIAVDVNGLLLAAYVHPANIQDRDGGIALVDRNRRKLSTLRKAWFDAGYLGRTVNWMRHHMGWDAEVVRRKRRFDRGEWHQLHLGLPTPEPHLQVLPRRWVVERTFAWLGRCRRLSKDYERLPTVSEAWIWLSMLHLLVKRLAADIAPTYAEAA